MELLLVLPDGSKSLVPAAWTDAKPSGADGEGVVATLGSLVDLLHVCELIADQGDRLQGCHRARRTPMQPVQLSLIPDPVPTPITGPVLVVELTPMVEQSNRPRAVGDRDHVAGQRDCQY